MAELYGKATGCCGGKGGSMHLGDPDVGMLPAIAIVAGGNSVVSGLGLAFKLRSQDSVAACFFGEGASNEGAFHEGLNFAAVQRLPIVFVCENNMYGASTSYATVSRNASVAERSRSYGIETSVVDGMDVIAVRAEAEKAVAACREKAGPVLLECKTYRFTGHSRSDAKGYRTRDEEAEWQERDPIVRLGRELRDAGLTESVLEKTRAEVSAEIEAAVEFARNSPDVEPQMAFEGVYA
jgi:TPP-dependent pyruvate/acetoin dehydrogenase alpha subunit